MHALFIKLYFFFNIIKLFCIYYVCANVYLDDFVVSLNNKLIFNIILCKFHQLQLNIIRRTSILSIKSLFLSTVGNLQKFFFTDKNV